MNGQHITASPASTGGAGTFFEQHVAAYWLAQLLVRGIPPILIQTTVEEVHFQTEHLGWHTDDFMVVCDCSGSVIKKKLVGQVKRTFTVSATDEECKKTILDFWKDYKCEEIFSKLHDRFILVTLRGTNTLLEHFVGLLDCARSARDGSEFEHRLSTKGFISNRSVTYGKDLCKIISEHEGCQFMAAEIWSFLRLLHVLSLDLDTSTRQTEAQIKFLLAYTLTEGFSSDVASTTWNELLSIASTAMKEARSLRVDELPEKLRQHHKHVGAKEQSILHALQDHTTPVLNGIRSTIGQNLHLGRTALVQKALEELETSQVILLSGPAGSGKSVIGKDTVLLLSKNHFVFGFRAEEFAQAHIDATLQAGQIPSNAKTLTAILATQGRKVILIESVERLLEKATRDAFSDLMGIAAKDSSLGIVLTCRDYSAEQVCASFLRPVGAHYAVVNVPPLSDEELEEIEAAFPSISYALKNKALRNILRNPFFIDKALEISWSGDKFPENEREFRMLFWGQIVRNEHGVPCGMARRREEVFQEIAVCRARALSPHIICTEFDSSVVAALRQDSLIVSPDNQPLLVSTSHDVLEDWVILQWLDELYLTHEESFKNLSTAVGAHPAIRRSYRKWVTELIQSDSTAADRLFLAAITEAEISAQFRDDTLVSLLKSPLSPGFLLQHKTQLIKNEKAILKRVIHLLRVACVKIPIWMENAMGHGSIFNVPDGPAWTTVIELVYRNIDSFSEQDYPLLVSFIEDAVRNVSWWEPELDGAEFVAGIGFWLLSKAEIHLTESMQQRVLKVIAKIPKADTTQFKALLKGTSKKGQKRDYIAEKFKDLLFTGTEGMQAARDFPDLIISIAIDYIIASEDQLLSNNYSYSQFEIETCFGLKEGLIHGFFPPSAIRGPWISLLRHHPLKGIDFMIKIFNRSADRYAHPLENYRLEPAWEIELTFADGTTRKQWGNPRLWNLYRGITVSPYVLQCLLMALEKWLLEYASKYPETLDTVLGTILRNSESAALSGVVASIATAHPHSSGEALLVLLSAPDYILFDRSRMAGESQALAMAGMFPQYRADIKIYEDERKESNQLSHRKQDLETAICNIQLGHFYPRVHAIFDCHLAALPPDSEQEKSDLIWRLAIHRMDIRQYTISETKVPVISDDDVDTDKEARHYIQINPKTPDPDVQAMVEESAAQHELSNARLAVLMWGIKIYENDNSTHDPSLWRENLTKAQSIDREVEDPLESHNGPGYVASVCVRDHWDEMSVDECNWCIEVVCSEISRKSTHWNYPGRLQRFSMVADRPCAAVVSLLLSKQLTKLQICIVRKAFSEAITHPFEEVRWYAISSINEQFWAINPVTAMQCVNVIATEAMKIDHACKRKEQKPSLEEICAVATTSVREIFWQDGAIAEDAHATMDISEWFSVEAIVQILAILGKVPESSVAIAAYERASQVLVEWWDARDEGKHNRNRNHDSETAISKYLREFLMRTTSASALLVLIPVLDAIDRHPDKIHFIIQGLTGIEDIRPNTQHYWYLWDLFANRIKHANWISRLDNKYPVGSEMLSAIFLTLYWKDNVRHWRSLEGYADHVHSLFEALPPSPLVLANYLSFLYHIGEMSLPIAFVRISQAIKKGDFQEMLAKPNTVFYLEVLFQRYVYGRPLELKSNKDIKQATLFLLDILVEQGSSAAFRMRDDFVTPLA